MTTSVPPVTTSVPAINASIPATTASFPATPIGHASTTSIATTTTTTNQPTRKQDSLINRDIQRLREENTKLESILSQLVMLNNGLQQIVDSRYPSPSHKRLLVEELERTHNISRRHACKLVNLARSSFWYKSTSRKPFPLRAKLPRTPLTELDRIRLFKSLSAQVITRDTTMDSSTLSFIEVSLKILGLRSAANLVRGNLKLAMEFFDQYVKYKKL